MILEIIREKMLKKKLRKLLVNSSKNERTYNYVEDFSFYKYDSFLKFMDNSIFKTKESEKKRILEDLIVEGQNEEELLAYCSVCKKATKMRITFHHSWQRRTDGKLIPNFRETIICPNCGLNNRLRATFHLILDIYPNIEKFKVYITEEISNFFKILKEKNSTIFGSEYFQEDIDGIDIHKLYGDVHNEDITKLSFSDENFDLVVSCDVLEHVPDYKSALNEIFRVIRKKGYFIFTVPFVPTMAKTIVRARVKNNQIEHILSSEYHGDPLNPEKGCLSFYHFGWELIEDLKDAGFQEAGIYCYHSIKFGYLGEGVILYAKK